MKVKDLILELQQCDPEDAVVMSSDAEGNSHSPLASLSEVLYVPDSTWSGDTYPRTIDDEDKKAGWSDDDLYHGDDGIKAVKLSPTN